MIRTVSALLLLVALATLGACATTGTAAQTFDQMEVIAGSANDAIVVTTKALLNAGTISSDQAEKVATVSDTVNALLIAANTAFQAGNTALANSNLSSANVALTTTQSCLTSTKAPVGSTLDTCIAPVVLPMTAAAHKAKKVKP
jgi:hypothetical protein